MNKRQTAVRVLLVGVLGCCCLAADSPPKAKTPFIPPNAVKAEFGVTKDDYPYGEVIGLEIEFRNAWTNAVSLRVAEQFGEKSTGRYEFTLRDTVNGKNWYVKPDPRSPMAGAPAKIEIVNLEPGDVLETRLRLPGVGMRFEPENASKWASRAANVLPAGKYELSASLQWGRRRFLTPPPATFSVTDDRPETVKARNEAKAKVLGPARAHLLAKLAEHKEQSGGHGLWARLEPKAFVPELENRGQVWSVVFTANVGQTVTMDLTVSSQGRVLTERAGFRVDGQIAVPAAVSPPPGAARRRGVSP